MMSLTLASGGSRTLSRPMSKSLLPLSANTALKPASSVRSTYRPGTTVDLAAVLLLPPAFARLFLSPPRFWPAFLPPLMSPLPASVPLPFPFPTCFCPTASPPAESFFLKFPIVFRLKVTSAMIVLSRLPGNKETSKDERNRKTCTGARGRGVCCAERSPNIQVRAFRFLYSITRTQNAAGQRFSRQVIVFLLVFAITS